MTDDELQRDNACLRRRLEEAEETIRAIRGGAVDAFVVEEESGHRIYTLEGADRPYRLLVEQMQQGAATLFADGCIAYCNRRAAELFGIPFERAVGTPFFDFVPLDEQDVCRSLFSQGVEKAGQGEVFLQRADGTRAPVLLTFNTLPRDCGAAVGLLITDLTVQKHHEQLAAAHGALRDSEAQLRRSERDLADFFENAALGLHWVGPDGIIQRANRAELSLLGYSQDEFVGRRIAEFHVDQETIRDILRRLQAGEEIYDYTARLRCKDGSIKHVLIDSNVLWEEGRFVHARCFTRDITDRLRAEEALREGERRLRFVMDSMPQKIFTASQNGDINYVNPQWTEFTGLSFEQISGWGWTQFIHPDDLNENLRVWRQAIDRGAHFQFEHRFRRADGEYLWHFSRALPMRDAEGRVAMWIGSSTDVHEQKKTASESQQLASELADLHRRKDEFLAMLSHELRNPLAPIANAVQLLRLQQNEDSLQRQARLIIERQVGQLSHLVDDLLEVSRISTGRINLHQERLDFRTIVERAMETTRPLIGQRQHALSQSLPPAPVWLRGDASRLEQVAVNLLANAAKYTEPGGKIWLIVERGMGEAVLRVRDTGIGIPPELLPRIFDLFTQADRSLDRSQGGLGVGLALVRQLVHLHGGRVEAISKVGEGSEFVVRLPADTSDLAEQAMAAVKAASVSPSCRVLVVDDNVNAAASLAMLLKMSGHDAHLAHDGAAALEAAREFRPDVVLLDIGLPLLNGYEVARRIREQPSISGAVVVAMTGYGQESDRQTSREAGFDHHLVKPADFEQLQQILATVIQKAK